MTLDVGSIDDHGGRHCPGTTDGTGTYPTSDGILLPPFEIQKTLIRYVEPGTVSVTVNSLLLPRYNCSIFWPLSRQYSSTYSSISDPPLSAGSPGEERSTLTCLFILFNTQESFSFDTFIVNRIVTLFWARFGCYYGCLFCHHPYQVACGCDWRHMERAGVLVGGCVSWINWKISIQKDHQQSYIKVVSWIVTQLLVASRLVSHCV